MSGIGSDINMCTYPREEKRYLLRETAEKYFI